MSDKRPADAGDISNYGDESYASLVEQQHLCQGPAADIFLVSQSQGQVVKKVMRITPTYFGRDKTPLGQNPLDKIHASFRRTFGRWYQLSNSPPADKHLVTIFFVDTNSLTLYKEYCTNGDLRQYSEQIESTAELARVMESIVQGLMYLHDQDPPIVHGCINPGNIYITNDLQVKLGEPSFSQLVVEFSHLTPSISVDWLVRWMSPEFFEDEPQTEPLSIKSDIWSLGCTFWEVVTGRLPYHRYKSNTEVLEQIITGVSPDLDEPFELPIRLHGEEHRKGFIEGIQWLVKKCWSPAPERFHLEALLPLISNLRRHSLMASPTIGPVMPNSQPSDSLGDNRPGIATHDRTPSYFSGTSTSPAAHTPPSIVVVVPSRAVNEYNTSPSCPPATNSDPAIPTSPPQLSANTTNTNNASSYRLATSSAPFSPRTADTNSISSSHSPVTSPVIHTPAPQITSNTTSTNSTSSSYRPSLFLSNSTNVQNVPSPGPPTDSGVLVLLWTSQDPRESCLFTTHWGVLYRFTTENTVGRMVTTLHRAIRQDREDRVAKLEWASNGGLGRAVIGRQIVPMADLVRPDGGYRSRTFNGPDGHPYQWSPDPSSQDLLLKDSRGNVTVLYRPIAVKRYNVGDVYGEMHFITGAGAGTVLSPPLMDIMCVTALLYRIVSMYNP